MGEKMAELFGDTILDEFATVESELARIGNLGQAVGRNIRKGLKDAIIDGKSLEGVLRSVAQSFADIALKAALKPIGDMVGMGVESVFKTFNPALNTGLGTVTPFAKGGVVGAPTLFPMNNDWGLMGEAGAEAIMPLARGSDGRLGVAGAGGSNVSISFNVQASDARSFAQSEAEISAMILRAVRRGARSA